MAAFEAGNGKGKGIKRLLDEVANGNHNSFEEFVEAYRPLLLKRASQLTVDYFLAEEVVQDTLMAVFLHADQFRGDEASFVVWLRRTLRNKLIDMYRHERNLRCITLEPCEFSKLQGNGPTPADLIQRLCLIEALEKLTTGYREIVFLRYFEYLSYQEIARRTGLPINTVKSRLYYAKKRLEKICKELFLNVDI